MFEVGGALADWLEGWQMRWLELLLWVREKKNMEMDCTIFTEHASPLKETWTTAFTRIDVGSWYKRRSSLWERLADYAYKNRQRQ